MFYKCFTNSNHTAFVQTYNMLYLSIVTTHTQKAYKPLFYKYLKNVLLFILIH